MVSFKKERLTPRLEAPTVNVSPKVHGTRRRG